jgi:hypothetical protein
MATTAKPFEPYAPFDAGSITSPASSKPAAAKSEERFDPYAPWVNAEAPPPPPGSIPLTPAGSSAVGAAVGAALNALTSTEDVQTEVRARKEAMKGKSSMADLNREINEQRKLVDKKHGKGFFDIAMERVMSQRALGQMPNVPETFDPFLGKLDETQTYARERQGGFGMGTKDVWAAAREGDKAAQELVRRHLAGELSVDDLAKYSAPVKRIYVDPMTQEAIIASRGTKATSEATDLYKGLNRYNQKLDLEAALPTYRGNTSGAASPAVAVGNVGAGTKTRSMLLGALGGLGLPLQADEIATRINENDPIGATIASVGAAGDIAAIMPTRANVASLVTKGAGLVAGALSPLALMAYDKWGPQILPFLAEKGLISPESIPSNYSVMPGMRVK